MQSPGSSSPSRASTMLFAVLLTEFPTNYFLREHEGTGGTGGGFAERAGCAEPTPWRGVSRPWLVMLPG